MTLIPIISLIYEILWRLKIWFFKNVTEIDLQTHVYIIRQYITFPFRTTLFLSDTDKVNNLMKVGTYYSQLSWNTGMETVFLPFLFTVLSQKSEITIKRKVAPCQSDHQNI